jgi:hypothetical protein
MLGWLLLVAAAAYALARVFAGYPRRAPGLRVLTAREAAFLEAAAQATFPPGGAIPPSGCDADVPAYTDRWLQVLHPRMRLLMRLLFFLVEHATVFFPGPSPRGWRRFSSLSREQQTAVLEGWRSSRFFARRLVFGSLRAILTMGYFAHPPVLRQLRLAPLAVEPRVCEADLLYPPVGRGPEDIAYGPSDLTPRVDPTPLDPDGPLHPRYAESQP